MKGRLSLLVYTSPEELRRTLLDFIWYCNYRRYHEAIGNVTPGRRPLRDHVGLAFDLTGSE